jgi:hypothetical protein
VTAEVIDGLRRIGYSGPLLEENYAFPDWFAAQQERRCVAAAFGQTPVSYDSACIGVVRANSVRREALVNQYRALAAPILLEIDNDEFREWAVARTENAHVLTATYPVTQLSQAFAQRAAEWKPDALMRAKNIGAFHWTKQLGLFSGLVPELEEEIQNQLEPLLNKTLAATRAAYVESTGRQPTEAALFKLVFWILTAKVFRDRRVSGFGSLSDDPDALLAAVAKHYKMEAPKLLNKDARQTAAFHVWNELDFRNLSVEVLSQTWSTTLVDPQTRRRLGIHRTPRTIVRYVVERIPFAPLGDDKRLVFEPCCGSAAFLIGVMNTLRQSLFGASALERHDYFVRHLAGVEYDPFGAEISTLALTLADFPNPNGWDIACEDVFVPGAMKKYLNRAGVVLCNPPFEDFTPDERKRYETSSPKKPATLLGRVLDDLHPSGVLGFVLPFVAVDGRGYADIRKKLAARFASVELTVLPDKAFKANVEVALLVATEPIPHDVCRVSFRRVNDDAAAWSRFDQGHEVSSDSSSNFGFEAAAAGFTIPSLATVWNFLVDHPRLGQVAELHRGLEWTAPLPPSTSASGSLSRFVRSSAAAGYMRGVQPKARFNVFEVPHMTYLSVRPADQRRNAWQLPWDRPKAILNKATKSRGPWRIAAFADLEGVTCYQTFVGVWPQSLDFDAVVLAAVLNSPLANAFVATREGKVDITMETLRLIPVPVFTATQRRLLHRLVERYQTALEPPLARQLEEDPEQLLKEIDAVVLDGYRMPARIEREVLDFFRGQKRPAAHSFSDYFPPDLEVYFSLSEFLDSRFKAANVGRLLKTIESR